MRIFITDLGDHDDFPENSSFQASGVPHVGDTINLFEILTPERLEGNQIGWWYQVVEIEWSMQDDTKILEPVLTVRRKNIHETGLSGN